MSKAHRGRGIRTLLNRGRGTCPVCNRTGIKVIYEASIGGKTVKTCKTCKAAADHGKFKGQTEQAQPQAQPQAGAQAQTPAT